MSSRRSTRLSTSSSTGDFAPPVATSTTTTKRTIRSSLTNSFLADDTISDSAAPSSASSVREGTGYSTPLTSNYGTPASFQIDNKNSDESAIRRSSTRDDAKFTLGAKTKIDNTTEESELSEVDELLLSSDALLARQLQEQEYKDADIMDVDDDEHIVAESSRAGASRPRRSVSKNIASFKIPTDDEDDEDDDTDFAPPPKRARVSSVRSRGSRQIAVPVDSEDESEFALESADAPYDDEDESEFEPQAGKTAAAAGTVEDDSDFLSDLPLAQVNRLIRHLVDSDDVQSSSPVKKSPKKRRGGRNPPTVAGEEVALDDSDMDSAEEADLEGMPIDWTDETLEGHVGGRRGQLSRRARLARWRLVKNHPELKNMWSDLKELEKIPTKQAPQPEGINRTLKPFQLEGVHWMREMEKTKWGGGLLGDEMGMGKTIQAVSLIMSDYPQPQPSLVLVPPVALMQWQQEIAQYTNGTLKTYVFHGTSRGAKGITAAALKEYDVILMSYNSLESVYRFQEKGRKRKEETVFQKSAVHQIQFHRVILDEAHNIKQRTTGSAKACFALKADHKWCLSGTPLQNRIGEFFSLIRFLDVQPFASYMCRQCKCTELEWHMNNENRCSKCNHHAMQHVSVFNQELLNPIQKHGNTGPGKVAFDKLKLLTDRFMLRREKRDHSAAMELPAKEIRVDRKFFGEEENDFAGSIMNSGTRKFETYVAQGVLLNNYANIFGLIMQMRQVADHPDLILKKNADGGQNILVCCICDEPADDAIRSVCKHDFCRQCVKAYINSMAETDGDAECPRCHLNLAIDLEQQEVEQDEETVKKNSIINRIKMENWTSSTKIESLVYQLHLLRSKNSSSKSIIFSGFTTMLQLVEWRLRRAGITTVMLDGSMTPAQRQASINAFMTDPSIECFLVSLKAGGVALNLTEASKVFIVDPWWNPAAEWQSADRCHRIGQARPCQIVRLVVEDSVESRMVLLQEKKTRMIESTVGGKEEAREGLSVEDMQFLFRGS